MDLGLPATMLRIYREEGVVVLFNGVVPRVLQLGFSHAVRFTAYGASRGFVVGSMLSDTDISSVLPKTNDLLLPSPMLTTLSAPAGLLCGAKHLRSVGESAVASTFCSPNLQRKLFRGVAS